jgi:hypothetical protein
MAFESFYDCIDRIAAMHEQEKTVHGQFLLLSVLTTLDETILTNPKFRSQRHHCMETLNLLNPAFSKGYYDRLKCRHKWGACEPGKGGAYENARQCVHCHTIKWGDETPRKTK